MAVTYKCKNETTKPSNAILRIVSNWQMYVGIGCIMLGIAGIGLALVFACC